MAVTWKKLAYEDDVITKALLTTEGDIIYASGADTPVRLGIGSDTNVLTLSGGVPTWAAPAASAAHKDSHDPEDGADALDCAAPSALLEVQAAAEGTAHEFARADHASALLEVQAAAEGTAHEFARADHAHEIVHDITDNSLVTIDGATNTPVDDDIAVFTANGLEGQTPAEVAATMALDDIGVPDATVDFDLQTATDLVFMTVANEAALPAANIALGQPCWATAELTLHVCTAIA